MTGVWQVLALMLLLQIKHFLVDWCLQPEYEWKNKGTYGHWGGIRHAIKNAIGTALCFGYFLDLPALLIVALSDFVLHYHIDFCKMRINKKLGWGPTTHPEFWMLTGLDQCLHQITYIWLIASNIVIG
jgi:hypothetical protein